MAIKHVGKKEVGTSMNVVGQSLPSYVAGETYSDVLAVGFYPEICNVVVGYHGSRALVPWGGTFHEIHHENKELLHPIIKGANVLTIGGYHHGTSTKYFGQNSISLFGLNPSSIDAKVDVYKLEIYSVFRIISQYGMSYGALYLYPFWVHPSVPKASLLEFMRNSVSEVRINYQSSGLTVFDVNDYSKILK